MGEPLLKACGEIWELRGVRGELGATGTGGAEERLGSEFPGFCGELGAEERGKREGGDLEAWEIQTW